MNNISWSCIDVAKVWQVLCVLYRVSVSWVYVLYTEIPIKMVFMTAAYSLVRLLHFTGYVLVVHELEKSCLLYSSRQVKGKLVSLLFFLHITGYLLVEHTLDGQCVQCHQSVREIEKPLDKLSERTEMYLVSCIFLYFRVLYFSWTNFENVSFSLSLSRFAFSLLQL